MYWIRKLSTTYRLLCVLMSCTIKEITVIQSSKLFKVYKEINPPTDRRINLAIVCYTHIMDSYLKLR